MALSWNPASGPIAAVDPYASRSVRFDWLWTLLPFLLLGHFWAETEGRVLEIVWFDFQTILPMISLLVVGGFGGMLLVLGWYWLSQLPINTVTPVRDFGRMALGGALATTMAFLLLPLQSAYSLDEIVPWFYLGVTLLLLVTALVRAGSLDFEALCRTFRGEGSRPLAVVAGDYGSMTKPSLNSLVLVTAFVGYWMASPAQVDLARCAWMMAGTALVAGASSVLNQVAELDTDALMRRTARRPLPDGRILPAHALTFGGTLAIVGLLLLARMVSLETSALAALTLGSYLFLYTPLKRINSLSTLAGGISGALPPVLGWVAAGRAMDEGALVLFLILFLWQMPHFLAISWKYREEYGRAGYPMFSVLDPAGRATGWQALLYTAALVAISLAGWRLQMTGAIYGIGALGLGCGMLGTAWGFLRRPTIASARSLFFSTLIYLPALLILMVCDRVTG